MYGGESSERSVSLKSGKYVFQSVKNLGYEAELIDYPSEFSPEKLSKEDFDQSYLSYKNFRKNYKEMLNDNFSEFEPRQRIFDLSDE